MNYSKSLIEIRPSIMLKGEIGIFAVRDLEIGAIIGYDHLMQETLFIKWNEYDFFDIETKSMIDKYCLGNNCGFFAPVDINHMPIPWHINHSCNPNVGFDEDDNFVTIKNVLKNEELTYDYAFGESNSNFSMICKCNQPGCRKIITGDDWKVPEFYRNNEKHMIESLRNREIV